MTEVDDPEKVIATLREQITETRKRRMAAQKAVAALPNLQIALERTSRDRSTGTTDATDALRQEIIDLRSEIMSRARGADRTRANFSLLDEEYPTLAPRARLVSELNAEARWRDEMVADERSAQLRLALPQVEEII